MQDLNVTIDYENYKSINYFFKKQSENNSRFSISRSSQQRTLFVFSSQTILSCHPTLCFCEFFLLLTVRLSSSKSETKKQETRVKRKRSKEFYCLAFQNMQDLTITIIKLEKLEMHKLLFQKTKQDQFWCWFYKLWKFPFLTEDIVLNLAAKQYCHATLHHVSANSSFFWQLWLKPNLKSF